MAVKGHSTVVQYGNQSTYATSNSWTSLTNLVDITPPNVEAEDIDTSHMDSTSQYETFVAGWANGGDVTFNLQYTKTLLNTVWGLFRTDKGFRVVLNDGGGWGFDGYIKSIGTTVERKGIAFIPVTVKVSGAPTVFTSS